MTEQNRFSFIMIMLLILALCLTPFIYEKEKKETIAKLTPKVSYDTLKFVRISSYQAEMEQTDDRPNETASGVMVTDDMYFNEWKTFGYCAVSRDLLNFKLNFFDTIYIKIDTCSMFPFIVIDCMNKRFENSVDILADFDYLKTDLILIKK